MKENNIEEIRLDNYKFQFIKKSTLFQEENVSYRYMCILNIFNELGTLIRTINMNEIDVSIILDNFYWQLSMTEHTSFEIKDNIFEIYNENVNYNNFRTVMKISDFNGERFSVFAKVDITDKMIELLQILYDLFLEDSLDKNIKSYDPSWLM